MRRVYCWRVGAVLSLELEEKCPECGRTDHLVHKPNTCGNFVSYGEGGVPCVLPISHIGECSNNRNGIVKQIHEC
jgi:hypothetical protein